MVCVKSLIIVFMYDFCDCVKNISFHNSQAKKLEYFTAHNIIVKLNTNIFNNLRIIEARYN